MRYDDNCDRSQETAEQLDAHYTLLDSENELDLDELDRQFDSELAETQFDLLEALQDLHIDPRIRR